MMTEPNSKSTEPKGCTLADLIFLTVGAAIASSLFWYANDPVTNQLAGQPAPAWYIGLNYTIELLQKSCLALMPVILHRRWRYGGSLKMVDYSIILTGIHPILVTIWRLPSLGILYKENPQSIYFSVNDEAFHIWNMSLLFVGMVAALAALIRRRQRLDWFTGVLIAVAWSLLTRSFEQVYMEWINDLQSGPARQWSDLHVRLLSMLTIRIPMGFLASIPLAIVLVDVFSPQRRQRVWVEWVSIGLVLILPIAFRSRYLMEFLTTTTKSGLDVTLNFGEYLSSLGLAYLVARLWEPKWRRFLEGPLVEHAGDEKPAPTSEP